MQRFFFLAALLVFSNISFAADENPLKHTMAEMGRRFGTLARQVQDPEQNTTSSQLAREINVLINNAIPMLPDVILAMPEASRYAEKLKFQRLLTQLLLANIEMEEKILINDNTGAFASLQEMNQIRQDGHRFFKPQTPAPTP